MALQLLKQLRHKHGILTAGNADRNLIPILYHLIFIDTLRKLPPDVFPEFLHNAPLHILADRIGI